MKRLKNVCIFLIFLLICFFLFEAVIYVQKEHLKSEIYALREEIIILKLQNRALKSDIEKILQMDNIRKWAYQNKLTEKWEERRVESP
mgnify:CR=1 FL=1|jgi:cell division protein FtsL